MQKHCRWFKSNFIFIKNHHLKSVEVDGIIYDEMDGHKFSESIMIIICDRAVGKSRNSIFVSRVITSMIECKDRF